jgi:hypothetical protein
MVVNCELVWREISNYVEDELDPTLHAAMEEHIYSCQQCASVLAGMQNVIAVYGDERMLEVPAGFSRRLEKKLAVSARGEKYEKKWPRWSAWLIPVAALALVVGGLRIASSIAPKSPLTPEVAQLERNIPPDLVVVAAPGTRLFHLSGCDLIRGKDNLNTMTAKEAMKQGYVPCTRCLRKYLDVAARKRLGLDSEADADADDEVKFEHVAKAGQ